MARSPSRDLSGGTFLKIGVERRRKIIIAGVVMSIAIFLAGHAAFQLQKVETAIPPATAPDGHQGSALRQNVRNLAPSDPTLHSQRLELAENQTYQGSGRNIFRSEDGTHRGRVLVPRKPSPPIPITDPVLAPIALRFFGFASMLNQPRKAFLGEGDAVFVANEGDIVNRRYRVLKIDSNSVVIEDLIEKSVHELDLHG
jgi:hypothetical protein